MSAKYVDTCYACAEPATTKEHAPPRSFFPTRHRTNLITVPSCAAHNNELSKDVEYTRNIISTMFGTNEIGQQHFADKSLRSFHHSPGLLHRTFADIRPVSVRGQTVGLFTVDTDRIQTVMQACVSALHFRETLQRVNKWELVLPNLSFSSDMTEEQVVQWRESLSVFLQIPFQMRTTATPDVFQFAVAEIDEGRVYGMRFYRNFLVYGVPRI